MCEALIALVTGDMQISAVMKGVSITPLRYEAMIDDLVWARIDDDSEQVRNALAKRKILHTEPGQVLLALSPREDSEALNMHGAHGHSELLTPLPGILRPAVLDSLDGDTIDSHTLSRDIFEPVEKLNPEILRILRPDCASVTASYEADLDRYTGITDLDGRVTIESRHSAHPDNKRVEKQLLDDLDAIGYCAHRHDFTHAGQTHSNIIADLPGTGILRIRPEILKRYREILRANPLPESLGAFEQDMWEVAESDWFRSAETRQIIDTELRYEIEKLFRLRPWYPWWKKECDVPGYGADLVIVGCHLDSTAGFEPGYVASTDPAPGRDDDASGLAAVLTRKSHRWN